MYTLNKTSMTSKFYSWVWNKDVTEFKNMCPYFWGYVLTVIFLPLIILWKFVSHIMPKGKRAKSVYSKVSNSKPVIAMEKAFDWVSSFDRFWGVVNTVFKWCFFSFVALLVIASLILLVITLIEKPMEVLAFISIASIVCVGVVVFVYLFAEKNLGKILWSPFKFVGNMVYSLYKNMCPLIVWNNK